MAELRIQQYGTTRNGQKRHAVAGRGPVPAKSLCGVDIVLEGYHAVELCASCAYILHAAPREA